MKDTLVAAAYGGTDWSPRMTSLRQEIGQVWGACGVASEWSPLKAVLLHGPGPELKELADPDAAQMLASLDAGRARRQHDALVRAYRKAGVTVRYVEPEGTFPPNLMFVADLARALSLPVRLDVVSVSSYPDMATRSCGSVFRLAPQTDLGGRDVLVVDDILDSGGTLAMLLETLEPMCPASLASCVLVRKDRPDVPDRIAVDYVGFDVGDQFVVGYGMDHGERYRNLPDICVLADEDTAP